MKRALVTGATGFIGRHVVPALLKQGFEVIAVSRKPDFAEAAHLKQIALDLHDEKAVADFMTDRRPGHLVHLAWEATPGTFWHSKENFRWITSSARLLDRFVAEGGKRAILTGSCAEYKWGTEPLDEESSPLHPTTNYSASKVAFHTLAKVIAKDIDLVWARIFFPFGPKEGENKLISHIVREISANRTPEFNMPGRAGDFIRVEDAAKSLAALTDAEITGPINICSGHAYLPHEIAIIVAELLGKPEISKALRDTYQVQPTETSVLGSREKLNSILSQSDCKSLEDGLKDYIAHMR
ncbi:MAG: NAD(P)-dependent oxidoreductase [Alphaproteobacteria bacterium]|nr:MAG: NAD(P)-dependent oxidoreductase [Alphaproteobacteria bacterium]